MYSSKSPSVWYLKIIRCCIFVLRHLIHHCRLRPPTGCLESTKLGTKCGRLPGEERRIPLLDELNICQFLSRQAGCDELEVVIVISLVVDAGLVTNLAELRIFGQKKYILRGDVNAQPGAAALLEDSRELRIAQSLMA